MGGARWPGWPGWLDKLNGRDDLEVGGVMLAMLAMISCFFRNGKWIEIWLRRSMVRRPAQSQVMGARRRCRLAHEGTRSGSEVLMELL